MPSRASRFADNAVSGVVLVVVWAVIIALACLALWLVGGFVVMLARVIF